MSLRVLTGLACVTVICTSALVWSQSNPQAAKAITTRQDNLEQIGDSFKLIRDQLRGDRDVAAITGAAETINDLAPQLHTWFPAGTGPEAGVETEALPVIWQKNSEFNAAADRLVAAAGDMLSAAQSGDLGKVGSNVSNLGGACKNCHDTFRQDDD